MRKLFLRDPSELRRYYWMPVETYGYPMPTARIARLLRLDRYTVRRLLKERGLLLHTRRSANELTAKERSAEQRRAQTAKANAARRKPDSDSVISSISNKPSTPNYRSRALN
jgi:hypothetical protein